MFNVVDRRFVFGKYNPRPLKLSVQHAMANDYGIHGCHNEIEINEIPVLVNRDQIDIESLIPPTSVSTDWKDTVWRDLLSIIDLPNGRHRTYGLKEWIEKLGARVLQAMTDLEIVEQRLDDEAVVRAEQLRRLIVAGKEQLAALGNWLGAFYDIGA